MRNHKGTRPGFTLGYRPGTQAPNLVVAGGLFLGALLVVIFSVHKASRLFSRARERLGLFFSAWLFAVDHSRFLQLV